MAYLGTEARVRGREAAGLRAAAERRKAAATGRETERSRDAMAGEEGARERRGRGREGKGECFRVFDLRFLHGPYWAIRNPLKRNYCETKSEPSNPITLEKNRRKQKNCYSTIEP